MQSIIKSIFVITTFFLHYIVMRDMTLHEGFRFAPILMMFLMSSVFLTAWIVLLWNKKQKWFIESVISISLGVFIWYTLFNVPLSDFLLIVGVLSVIAFGAFTVVSLCGKHFIERYIPRLFFGATIIGLMMVIAIVLFKDDSDTAFMGNLIFLPLMLAGGLMYGIILPFIKIMFPLYVWIFIQTDQKLLTRYGAVLFIFPMVAFFTSSHGVDVIQSIGNPCYEVVEGKAPSYVIQGNHVCIVGSRRFKYILLEDFRRC